MDDFLISAKEVETPSGLKLPDLFSGAPRALKLYAQPSKFCRVYTGKTETLVFIGFGFDLDSHKDLFETICSGPLDQERIISLSLRSFGRYIIVCCDETRGFILPGPAAQLHYCYTTDDPIVASSEYLLKRNFPKLSEYDNDIPEVEKIAKLGNRYAFGLTPNSKIRVGMANHILEIEDRNSTEKRFWPSENDLASLSQTTPERDRDIFRDKLTKMLHRNTQFAASLADSIVLPITSGRDSRTVLALLSHTPHRVTTFTHDIKHARSDIHVGPLLAKAVGAKWQKGSDGLRGLCLTGFGGEIFKGYWSRKAPIEMEDRIGWLLSQVPFYSETNHSVIKNAGRAYAEELVNLTESNLVAAELLYPELKWGATYGKVLGEYDLKFSCATDIYASYDVISASIKLPIKDRERMAFWREVCSRKAPYLTTLPAGIPHFSGSELKGAFFRLALFPFLSRRVRVQVASKEYILSIVRLLRVKFLSRKVRG